ncbi:chloride channel protein [Frateuria aurantia]
MNPDSVSGSAADKPPHPHSASRSRVYSRYLGRRINTSEWLSPRQWQRRILFWSGAIIVGLAAVGFAWAADAAFDQFSRLVHESRFWPFIVTPAVFAFLSWATNGVLKSTRGSGIPQAIAALRVEDEGFRHSLLSLKVAVGKMALTLLALVGGASVGREGPTVHVGAGLLYTLGRRFGLTDAASEGRFILAGSAAGLAAAFNTPLAGVVFAIEEMSGAFEHRMSGVILTAVIMAGVVSLGLLGNYAYFGRFDIVLPLGRAWIAVAACGLICGLMGGLYARLIQPGTRGVVGWVATTRARNPVLFAAGCGMALVVLSQFTHHGLYGTGYQQAKSILQQDDGSTVVLFGILKMLGNIACSWAGIPGGFFSPSLAVGAGLGENISHFLPSIDPSAVVLLGMTAYLAGVTQAPLTSTVISMELTANQQMVLPIMAAALLARAASALVCRKPIYRALADVLVKNHQHEQELKRGHRDAEAEEVAARGGAAHQPDSPRAPH